MKKVLLALCFVASCTSYALADDLAMADTVSLMPHAISGMVKSVSWADPVKGTKSEIVVLDASKKMTHVLVTSTTTLWDADTKPIMSDKIIEKSREKGGQSSEKSGER